MTLKGVFGRLQTQQVHPLNKSKQEIESVEDPRQDWVFRFWLRSKKSHTVPKPITLHPLLSISRRPGLPPPWPAPSNPSSLVSSPYPSSPTSRSPFILSRPHCLCLCLGGWQVGAPLSIDFPPSQMFLNFSFPLVIFLQ